MSIQEVVLTGSDEEFAPPSRVLTISQVSDRVFISISNYSETFNEEHLTDGVTFSVTRDDLDKALAAVDDR